MMKYKCISACCVVFMIMAGASSAQENTDPSLRARDLYQQGIEHFQGGRYAEAAGAFREAHRLRPSWKIHYNIGQSEAAARRYGLAIEAFESYLAQGGDDVPPDRRDEVLKELQRMRLLVGMLDIKGPKGSIVIVDGVERARLPLGGKIRIVAGVGHAVIVNSKNGDELLERPSLRVGGGEVVVLEVEEKVPVAAAAPVVKEPEPEPVPEEKPAEEPEDDDEFPYATVGWIGIGIGGAVLAGGAIAGGLALSTASDLEGECTDGVCPADSQSDVDKMNSLGTTSTIMLSVGAAVAATGLVFLLLDMGDEEEDADTQVSAGITGSGAALSVIKRF